MKTFWTGTDVLLYYKRPKLYKKWWYVWAFRLFVKLTDVFCEEHFVVSEHLIPELKGLKKNIKVLVHPVMNPDKVDRIPHEGINILYLYKPGKFWEWIYGTDIIEQLIDEYPQYNFIRLMSGGKLDVKGIYSVTDLLLRPNRHDGGARMVDECKISGIPYYWSKENPNINEMRRMLNELSV